MLRTSGSFGDAGGGGRPPVNIQLNFLPGDTSALKQAREDVAAIKRDIDEIRAKGGIQVGPVTGGGGGVVNTAAPGAARATGGGGGGGGGTTFVGGLSPHERMLADMRRQRERESRAFERQMADLDRRLDAMDRADAIRSANMRLMTHRVAGGMIGTIGGAVSGSPFMGGVAGVAASTLGIPGLIGAAALSVAAANTTQGASRIHQFGGWLEQQTRPQGFLREMDRNLFGVLSSPVRAANMVGWRTPWVNLNPFASVRELGGLVEDARQEAGTEEKLLRMLRERNQRLAVESMQADFRSSLVGVGMAPLDARQAINRDRRERANETLNSTQGFEARRQAVLDLRDSALEDFAIARARSQEALGFAQQRMQMAEHSKLAAEQRAEAFTNMAGFMTPGQLRRVERLHQRAQGGEEISVHDARELYRSGFGELKAVREAFEKYSNQYAPAASADLERGVKQMTDAHAKSMDLWAEAASKLEDFSRDYSQVSQNLIRALDRLSEIHDRLMNDVDQLRMTGSSHQRQLQTIPGIPNR